MKGIGFITRNLTNEEYFLRQRAKIILEDNYWNSVYYKEFIMNDKEVIIEEREETFVIKDCPWGSEGFGGEIELPYGMLPELEKKLEALHISRIGKKTEKDVFLTNE